MRRSVFLSLGVLELLVALVLVVVIWELPGRADVEDRVTRIEGVGQNASRQVEILRDELQTLRDRRPQLQAMATRLQTEMRLLSDELRSQRVDFDTAKTISEALGDVAKGLDGMADVMAPKGVGRIATAMKSTADLLDKKVAAEAAKAADRLDKTTKELKTDAARLAALLRLSTVDLKAVREVHDGLAKFDDGLARLETMLKLSNAESMREGFKGMETALTSGAGQVEKLAGYTYPVVKIEGFKPVVEQKPFWPEGAKIAAGMKKAAKGSAGAAKELEKLTRDLPELRKALAESRKVTSGTRMALAAALKQEGKLTPVLKDVPARLAALAEELPKLAGGLAKVLRDTSQLKELAAALREAQEGVEKATARWPELRKDLGRSAELLRTTQKRLKEALSNRSNYEGSLQHTLLLTRTFSAALPLVTEQVEEELREQDRSLAQLGASIDQVTEVMPVLSRGASRLVQMTRLLLGLMAGIFALHGGYLIAGWRMGTQFSP